MTTTHYFPNDQVHFTWDHARKPLLHIASGDTVVFETRDVSDGQFYPGATTSAVAHLNWNRVYPLAGPVFIEGAEPGDTLSVEILQLHPLGWGWTAILPGLGLLSEDFPDAYLRTFDLSNGRTIPFRDDIHIPFHPFFGTMGVCPQDAHEVAIMPPGPFGGNMDTKHLTVGTKLFLPVQVTGALFSCGDAHAVQGDGEVCVTGLECPMFGALRFEVLKGRKLHYPEFQTSMQFPSVPQPQYGTTGVGPDLMKAAQDAVRSMISYLVHTYQLSREDAYLLTSLCGDLKISEVVDAGQYVVSMLMPLSIFQS